jgi:hypothetical protein
LPCLLQDIAVEAICEFSPADLFKVTAKFDTAASWTFKGLFMDVNGI